MPPTRRRRSRRQSYKRPLQIAAIVAVVLALPFAALAGFFATANPNWFKPRIEAAVSQALGREFRIHGDLSFRGTFWPTIVAQDVTVANAPGGSRHDMIQMDQMQMDLSKTAALTGRTVLKNLVLLRPDILLENEANGVGNWRFDEPSAPARPQPTASRPAANTAAVTEVAEAKAVSRITLQTLHVHEARVTWRDRVAGTDTIFQVNRISATAASTNSPVTLDAEVQIGRRLIEFSAQTGPLSRLQDTQAQTPWGLFVNIDSSGAKLTVSGSVTRPLELRGYSLRLDGVIDDLSRISWALPIPLPPLRGVTLTAKLLDQGGPIPDISGISIQSGPTNLEKVASGLSVDIARIDAPRLTEPLQLDVQGAMIGAPVKLTATLGPPALLLPGARRDLKFPISIVGEAVGASFTVRGEIASPVTHSGMNVFISARIPDLARLAPLTGLRLPDLKSISFDGRLTEAGRDYLNGITLSDAKLTLPQGDLYGDASLLFANRLGLRLNLFTRSLDADSLAAQFKPLLASAPSLDDLSTPANNLAGRSPELHPLITAIPSTPLPFDALNLLDLDLTLTVGDLILGGTTYHDIAGHLLLRDGALKLDPFSARLPGGKLDATLTVDSRQPASPVALTLHGPGLELKPVMDGLGLPIQGTGTIDVDAELTGSGRSLHAIAGSLDGHVNLGIADAAVDNWYLGPVLGGLSSKIDPSERNQTTLNCAVLQADARHGLLTIRSLVLDSRRFLVNASGNINLQSEAVSLAVRPMMRSGGPGVVVPARVDGTLRNLHVSPNTDTSGAPSLPSEHGADACGPALSAVRAHLNSAPSAAAAPLAASPVAPSPLPLPAALAPPKAAP